MVRAPFTRPHATYANHRAGKCSGIPVGYFRVYGIPLSFLSHRTMSSPADNTGEIVPLFLSAESWLRYKCDRFSHLVRHFAANSWGFTSTSVPFITAQFAHGKCLSSQSTGISMPTVGTPFLAPRRRKKSGHCQRAQSHRFLRPVAVVPLGMVHLLRNNRANSP